MDTKRLKQCPCCGADGWVTRQDIFDPLTFRRVTCIAKSCGIHTKAYPTEDEAIAVWNKRKET